MRPPISGWFDSTIRIWRPTVSKDSLGAESRSYIVLATVGAAINRSVTANQPSDGGRAELGRLRWYGLPTLNVQPRDVCEIMTGPDAGHTWEVDAYPVHPRGHHTQVDCVEWHGKLQEIGIDSGDIS